MKSPTREGDDRMILLANFTTRSPSTPPGANVAEYVIEGYFDQALGGDFWTSTRDAIVIE